MTAAPSRKDKADDDQISARGVALLLCLFLLVALALGFATGTISEKMLKHAPPSPSDPITVP